MKNGYVALALSISKLLDLFREIVQRARRKRAEREQQTERDKLADNPSAWFDDHFGGMPNDNNTGATTKASKTDAGSDDKPAA